MVRALYLCWALPTWLMNRRAGLRLARGLSWTQVTEIVSSDDLGRFGRTASELARYQRHKSAVLQEWASMSDFLCAEIFDVAPVLDADGKKRAAVPDSDSDGGAAPPLVWRENAFPYAVRRGIEHHCVWSTSAAALRDEARFREVLERHRPSDTFATCHFINPPALQSVRALPHAHVLSLRRDRLPRSKRPPKP